MTKKVPANILLGRMRWHIEEIYKLRAQLESLFYTDKKMVDTQLEAIKEILNGQTDNFSRD
jgi:hypothetical protein